MKKFKLLVTVCLLSSFYQSLNAAVNDLIPSDYEAPLSNSSVMSLNYLTKELNTSTLDKNQYIKQNTYALRYTYGLDIDGKILALGIAVPYSDLKTNGEILSSAIGQKSSGLSDTVFSSSYWFINDRKKRDFLALTMTVTTPNGHYNQLQNLNAGENRYKTTFAIGYITKLTDSVLFELSPEIGIYGDNKTQNSTIEQKNSYAITSNLRYKPNNKYELFTGFQHNYLGDSIKNDITQNSDYFYQKYSVGAAYYTDKFNQIMIRFAHESDKEYGLSADKEMLIRYRWWF